jgi:hypothetical protein
MGWEGSRSLTESVVGSIRDQVSSKVEKMVLVCQIRMPICNTKSILILLPANTDYNPGIYEVIEMVKNVAEDTGSNITALSINDSTERYELIFNSVKPALNVRFIAVKGWKNALNMLSADSRNKLVIYIRPRRDTPGWHPESNTLLNNISSLSQGNLIIVYPATEQKVDEMKFLRID